MKFMILESTIALAARTRSAVSALAPWAELIPMAQLWPLLAAAVVASAAPVLPPLHPIFRAGEGAPLPTLGNYSCYMNPAAITLKARPSTVLLFVEARWPACDDFTCRVRAPTLPRHPTHPPGPP